MVAMKRAIPITRRWPDSETSVGALTKL